MDAQTELPATTDRNGPDSRIAPAEIRSILSNLSHEFSRPLVTLRMGFDLLLADSCRPISVDQRGHVRTMALLCDDLLRLTRSYLDYAGLVQGTRPLSFGTFTVAALVREIDRQFARSAADNRIGWECALEGPDANVTTDASLCQQIFANLVSNALKYTPEGGEVQVVGRRRRRHTGSSPSPTTGRASRPSTSTASSSRSTGSPAKSTRDPPAADSAWRSAARWWPARRRDRAPFERGSRDSVHRPVAGHSPHPDCLAIAGRSVRRSASVRPRAGWVRRRGGSGSLRRGCSGSRECRGVFARSRWRCSGRRRGAPAGC